MPTGGKICVTQLGSLEAAAAVYLAALVVADTPPALQAVPRGIFLGHFLPCLFAGVPRYCGESPWTSFPLGKEASQPLS